MTHIHAMESQFNKVTTANALLRYQVATFALNYTLSRLLCADNSHNVGSDSKEQSLGNLVEVQLFEEGMRWSIELRLTSWWLAFSPN